MPEQNQNMGPEFSDSPQGGNERREQPAEKSDFEKLHEEIVRLSDYESIQNPNEKAEMKRVYESMKKRRDDLYQEARRHGFLKDAEKLIEDELANVITSGDWAGFNSSLSQAARNYEHTSRGMVFEEKGKEVRYASRYGGIVEKAIVGAQQEILFRRQQWDPNVPGQLIKKRGRRVSAESFMPLNFAEDELDILYQQEAEKRRSRERERPQVAPQGMDEEAKGYLRRQAEYAEKQAQAVKTPEQLLTELLDLEEGGVGVQIPALTSNIWEGMSEKIKGVWQSRLKILNVRSNKQSAGGYEDFKGLGGETGEFLGLTKEQLTELTEHSKVAEGMCIYSYLVGGEEDKDKKKVWDILMGKKDENGRDIPLADQRPYVRKKLLEITEESDLKAFRHGIRRFIKENLLAGMSEEEAARQARESEQIAYNFLIISHLVEEKYKVGSPPFPPRSLFNMAMWEMMHPRLKAINEAKAERAWPRNELGKWIRHHFTPRKKLGIFQLRKYKPMIREGRLSSTIPGLKNLKAPELRHTPFFGEPLPSDIPLLEQSFNNFFGDKDIFQAKSKKEKKNLKPLSEILMPQGKALVLGTIDSVKTPNNNLDLTKIDWWEKANEKPLSLYQADRVSNAVTIHGIFSADKPELPPGKTWEDIGKAAKKLNDKDKKLRKGLVYLVLNVTDARGKDSKDKSERARYRWVKPHYRMFTPALIMAPFWWTFTRRHSPSYLKDK